MIKRYRKIFNIPEEIQIQIENAEGKQELTYIPEEKKAVIQLDFKFPQDLAELLAQLKLGVEYHPLLATFYFQPDLKKEEEVYTSSFYTLVVPIMDAWVYQTMQNYLPSDELEKQVEELMEIWEKMELQKLYTGTSLSESIKRRHSFSTYLIFKTLGYPANLKLIGEGKQLQEWVRYKKAIEEAVKQTPSPEVLAKIPERTKAPYRVEVKDKYYVVQANE